VNFQNNFDLYCNIQFRLFDTLKCWLCTDTKTTFLRSTRAKFWHESKLGYAAKHSGWYYEHKGDPLLFLG